MINELTRHERRPEINRQRRVAGKSENLLDLR